jgi:TRAP-type C4-dicarboxylate transport system substrate-binding protein
MVLFTIVSAIIGFIAGGLAACAPKALASEVIKLKAISSFSKGDVWDQFYEKWIENVNKRAKGRLKIEYVGGPEVVNPFKCLEPVRDGIYDVVHWVPGYVWGISPDLLFLNQITASPSELRKKGVIDAADKIMREKFKLTVLGQVMMGGDATFLTKKPFTSLGDLRGLRVRTIPLFTPVAEALGLSTISISVGELYSALEKGIVDGLIITVDNTIFQYRLQEVTTYVMYPGITQFNKSNPVSVNAKRFDSLPKDLQKLLVEEIIKIEPMGWEHFEAETGETFKKLEAAGLKLVRLSPEDTRRLNLVYFESNWRWFAEKAPDTAAKMREVLAPFFPK